MKADHLAVCDLTECAVCRKIIDAHGRSVRERLTMLTVKQLISEIQSSPCDCGEPHVWITWRGYQVGPFSPELAGQILGMLEMGAASAGASDPMALMAIGAIGQVPAAIPCRDPEATPVQ